MDFDEFFLGFDRGESERSFIALAIYFQTEFVGTELDEIETLLYDSEIHFSYLSLPQYIKRLEKEGWITSTENDGLRLTSLGRREVEQRFDGELETFAETEDFVKTEDFDLAAHKSTAKEINYCYHHGLYDATVVLYRKLMEELLFEILRNHYGSSDESLFMKMDDSGNPTVPLNLSSLITNFDEKSGDLSIYSSSVSSTAEVLEKMKDIGNSGAHSVEYGTSAQELKMLRENAKTAMSDLHSIYKRASRDGEDDEDEVTLYMEGSAMSLLD